MSCAMRKERTDTNRVLFPLLKLAALSLLLLSWAVFTPPASAGELSVVKMEGSPIDVSRVAAGDHVVVGGAALDDGDWDALRGIGVSFSLTVGTPNDTVPESALSGCAGLTSVSVPQAVEIGNNALISCANLTSVSLPQAVEIGNNAFSGCANLTSVSLPQAEKIGDYAFWSCTSLASVSLPQAEKIGGRAFQHCTNLASVSLPQASEIEIAAFGNCTSLVSVSLPQAVEIGGGAFLDCTNLTSVSLPQAVEIGVSAFLGCTDLTSVSLPQASEIGVSAFGNCASLVSVSLPQALKIGEVAFNGCANLTSVSLPQASEIDVNAFGGCLNLNLMILRADSPINTAENIGLFGQPVLFITTKNALADMFNGLLPGNYPTASFLTMPAADIDALAGAGAYLHAAATGGSVTLDNATLPVGAVNFQWYGDNGAIAGAIAASYNANAPGVYSMEFTVGVTPYSLPANRVVLGSAPTIAGGTGGDYKTGSLAMNETFNVAGENVELIVINPLPRDIAVAVNLPVVTFSGNLPDATSKYVFVLGATNPYAFWSGDIGTASILTYMANVTAVRDVAFESNGGSAVASIRADVGSVIPEAKRPQPPTKKDYNFAGWHRDANLQSQWNFAADIVPGEMTLYARWSGGPVYTITFDSQGGSDVASAITAADGTVAEPPAPSKPGYFFAGWYTSLSGGSPWNFTTGVFTADTILYARWSDVPVYTVTFDSRGGSDVGSVQVAENDRIEEPTAPRKLGYAFVGWYSDLSYATPWNFATGTVTGDMTLYARWKAADTDPAKLPGDTSGCASGMGGVLSVAVAAFIALRSRRGRAE